MIAKLSALFKKYRELISYVFFGGLTTVVSFASFFLLEEVLGVHYMLAQGISWVLAVAFAFVVNKCCVFEDRDVTKSGIFRQLWQFVSVRIASGVLESLLLMLAVELCRLDEGISKVAVSVLTVILNYFASKFLIFKKGEKS